MNEDNQTPQNPAPAPSSQEVQPTDSNIPFIPPESRALKAEAEGGGRDGVTPSRAQMIGSGAKSIAGGIFSWVILPIIIVLILHNFVFQAYHVIGSSMVQTLHETDYLIISKLGYTQALIGRTFGQNTPYIPARGQIIVFHYPKDPSKVFVKRVIGLPGDRVVIQNGNVTVFNTANPNGFNPDKGYESANTDTQIDTDEVVQPGNVFVMGDNRTPGGSYDSREWGQLPSSYIIGNAVLRLLPLDQVKIL